MCRGTQVGQFFDSTKSTSSDKAANSRNETYRCLFMTEPTGHLAVRGHNTVTSDEDLSPSVEEASVPLSNLVHGRSRGVGLIWSLWRCCMLKENL